LTLPPETITLCRWRLRHIEFQHKARRHPTKVPAVMWLEFRAAQSPGN
jgi:hypothetical protein